MHQEIGNLHLILDHDLGHQVVKEVLRHIEEIHQIKTNVEDSRETMIEIHLRTQVIEVEAVTMIETKFLTEELTMNQIQGNPFEIFTIKAWPTLLLYKPNSKKRYQLHKIVSEDLQSGSCLKDKKKKKAEDTSNQEKYS